MGVFPVYYSKPDPLWRPIDGIYPYIESGIPVLVSFEKNNASHASVVVGHKMYSNDKTPDIDKFIDELKTEESNIKKYDPQYALPAILSSSIFLDAFIIHDDQKGIYKLLPIDERAFQFLSSDGYSDILPMKVAPDQYVYKTVEDDIDDYIIPLPDKIYILGDEVLDIAKTLYKSLLKVIAGQYEKGHDSAGQLLHSIIIATRDPLIFRTYFIKSVEFKEKVLDSDMDDKVINYYRMMAMPRFIWVVEISYYSLYLKDKKILGEIVFDSTANKYDKWRSFLSVHLPGYFYKNENIKNYSTDGPDINIPRENPYKILWRTC